MKVHLDTDAGRRPVLATTATHAVVEGACPHCKATPFRARGNGMQRGHDTYTADATCVDCGKFVGRLVVTMNTLFGLDEDEAMLNGRPRVY